MILPYNNLHKSREAAHLNHRRRRTNLRAPARVKSALHAAEDGDLHPATFDDIARPLVLALRDLDELTISLGARLFNVLIRHENLP